MKQHDIKQTPQEILEEAKEKHGIQKFTVLFSGGKDSLTTAHMLWKMGYLHEILYCNTGIGLKENFDFVLQQCDKYGWKLNVEYPPKYNYEQIVAKFGFPKEPMHNVVMNFLKWRGMRSYLKKHKGEHIAFVSGRRKKESKRRQFALKEMSPIYSYTKTMQIISPLFYLTNNEVMQYVKNNQLEMCPVYETLHISGDCLCGCFFLRGDAEIIAIFYPEMAKRISDLEKKYGGHWGRYSSSMTGAMKQSTLDALVCNDCYMDYNK